MNLGQKSIVFLATGFHIGKIPFAPGTFGALLGLPLCFFLSRLSLQAALFFTLTGLGVTIWIAHHAQRAFNENDPSAIVIDEIAGMAVTLLGLPFTFTFASAGFCLFRFFDILKPFPIRYLEKRVPGGAGIVLDDVLAGIFSNILLRVAYWYVGGG